MSQEDRTAQERQLRSKIARLQAEVERLHATGMPAAAHPPISAHDQEHIIAHLQDAVIVTDLQFTILSWNDAAARLYGWTADEVLGRALEDAVPTIHFPDGGDIFQAAAAALKSEGVWRGEVIQVRRGGGEVMVSSTVQTLRGVAGEPRAYLAINRDITAQRAAAHALQGYAERLQIIYQMNQHTLAGDSLETMVAEMLTQLRRLIPAQHASVLLYNLGERRTGSFLGVSSDLGSWPAVGDVIDMGVAPTEVVERSSQVRVYEDLSVHMADMPTPVGNLILQMGLRAVLSIPLLADGVLIGSLNLAATTPQRFPDEQIAIAREVGSYLASSVQAARLRENEQRARRIAETLHRAGMALIQSLDLNAVLEALLDYLQKLVPYDSANVMLHQDGIFKVYSMRGYDHRPDQEQIRRIQFDVREHRITRQILERRRSLLIRDTASYPGWVEVPGGEEIRSWMGIPIISRGELLGIYAVNKTIPAFFDEESVALAETLATVAAAAIANALLYAQAQQEITERRRVEANLEAERAQLACRVEERTADLIAANVELARASRLKDEFLANMSHELRTPLNTVLGRAEIMREQIYGPLTEQQRVAIASIDESGRHLLALINDILDLSKIEAGKLDLQIGTVDVSALCQASMRMVAQAAMNKGIGLSTTMDMAVELLQADERRLKQILVNLLSNAVKFTPSGGRVSLEVSGSPERNTIEFAVSDTGIGIAEADMSRLFQPFVQIDAGLARRHEGTGLGLSLALRLAEAHGGSLTVTSAPGIGSRFSVTLPWAKAAPVEPAETADAPLVLQRALVIDDSQPAAEQVVRYLASIGCDVTTHARAGGALELAAALQPELIILDVLLPDQTGWSVLRQLKGDQRTRAIPVLVLSVVDEPDLARQLGAEIHLLKPIDRAALLQAIRQIGQANPPVAPQPGQGYPPPAPPPRRRILLAEDNEENISLLMDFLPLQGYELLVARNGNEAISMARTTRPAAILMDIQMPKMDGVEATRRIRADAELCETPIIALTALAMPGDRDRCLGAGADAYLVKPVTLSQLPNEIEAAIRKRGGS